MTTKQNVILKILIELTEAERREIIKELQNFETKTFSEQKWLNESLNKSFRSLGPISGSCPYCGK